MKGKRKYQLIRGALLLIMVVCLIPVVQAYFQSMKHQKQQKEIKMYLVEDGTENLETNTDMVRAEENEGVHRDILGKYKNIYNENQDLAGWLTIEGTDIDYPVMQCEDDDFYLSHNFYRETDKYGCLYVKSMADLNTPGTNFIIYGHNMKDGSMFGGLDQYQNEDFYQEHTHIFFDTLYEERIYEVMAVFSFQLYREEQSFQYYKFYQADTEAEFMDFYENIHRLALYDTGVTASFGDTFLTLSTCADKGVDRRFVVVAKRADSL